MKLDRQQKITTLLFGIMIVLAVGMFVFLSVEPHETKTLQLHPTFSIFTPTSDLSSNGWWNNIPTAKVVPILSGANATPSPTAADHPLKGP